ncbi:hypothetical protein AVEN_234972-1 [Araneus ventricosus]|uniref:Uncharacterized protein n=1 Tax=Araneus ventricosus TaxID=182803 RepID=A0A4Y2FP13_ARAVE|nr:hypothetical protein AVEN_234972-1 [Araneus ventricosus]
MFCQLRDRCYATNAKTVVLSCGRDVHEWCERHLDRSSSLCLRCMRPLTEEGIEEIRRVSREDNSDASMNGSSAS